MQIGQSEGLVYLYFEIQKRCGDAGLTAVLTTIDASTLLLQLAIFKLIFMVSA